MILSCPACSKRFLLDAALLGSGRRVKCGNCGHIWHQEPDRAAAAAPAMAPRPAARPAPRPAPAPAPEAASADLSPGFPPDFSLDGSAGFESAPDDDPFAPATSAAPAQRPRPLPLGSNLPVPLEPERPRRGAMLRWGGLATVVAGLAAGIFFGRDAIVEGWPPAKAFYELVGMPVAPELPGAGLVLPPDKVRSEFRTIEGTVLLFVSGAIENTSDRERPVPDVLAWAIGADGQRLFSWRIIPPARVLAPGQSVTFDSRMPERQGEAKAIEYSFVAPEPVPETGF
ncbi:zinc-ribbon domain-containing protein [Rhodospirillum centenum]|uniref:Zinc finger/thioredoxin putative domain-containing protein n=1 Tax=Rhodospirillum centenum (strain ATCC 51521 / SW) TaxID=414684 RepID=B6IYR4_RHOCS|nr:zinc-ribbon domain-containing protein [Rhodospirillum centenum]ACJ01438.1 conserved hypothetical protein [Rhodospirillum centenum SW]